MNDAPTQLLLLGRGIFLCLLPGGDLAELQWLC